MPPRGQRRVEGGAQSQTTGVKSVVEGVDDDWDTEPFGRREGLLYGPQVLVILQCEMTEDLLLALQGPDNARSGSRPVAEGAAEMKHQVSGTEQGEEAGDVA